jgi:hypothetical protein
MRTFLAYVFRTPDLSKVPRPTWAVVSPIVNAARVQGFHIIELTLDQVCELHAARELYSSALQGDIAYSGAETLAWLRTHFALFVKDLAFRKLPAEGKTEDSNKKTSTVPANDERKPSLHPIDIDATRLRQVLDMVREQRIVDISAVLSRLGNEDLRDSLLRTVEAHPNLKAHPGPKTIFLQWRIITP